MWAFAGISTSALGRRSSIARGTSDARFFVAERCSHDKTVAQFWISKEADVNGLIMKSQGKVLTGFGPACRITLLAATIATCLPAGDWQVGIVDGSIGGKFSSL